ncbi:MAG TPA: hypothetical protein VHE53_02990 [Patescibacteria group bacterium]|nr:hypothetical protein [Patescibacteria group bacterium]
MKDRDLRPAPQLSQNQIDALHIQMSRNQNGGGLVTLNEAGYQTRLEDPEIRCAQNTTGSCVGCPVYEDLLPMRLRRRGDQSIGKVVDKFSEEWCPPDSYPTKPAMTQGKIYLVSNKV